MVIDVEAAGVAFPEVLQSWGRYQVQPELPFVPGSEVAGVVRSAPDGAGVAPGDKVMAFCVLGGFAEVAVAPPYMTFPLPNGFDFADGAGFPVNYHTAWFGLVMRGRMVEGDWVLVHGAAGGLGLAAVQVAAASGARAIAVVSTAEKEAAARAAGATHVVRSDGDWLAETREHSGGGFDIVFDPVGGDRFTDSLRSCREEGRVVVAGWGAYMVPKPDAVRKAGVALEELRAGGPLKPPIGARFPLKRVGDALQVIEGRQAIGKIVLDVRA